MTHAPHTGCDSFTAYAGNKGKQFQSTHPMQGATIPLRAISMRTLFQSTHPLRRATRYLSESNGRGAISIHAPHTGCDLPHLFHGDLTPISIHAPHAGCDIYLHFLSIDKFISIHAPLAGCDQKGQARRGLQRHFNPRTREGCDLGKTS